MGAIVVTTRYEKVAFACRNGSDDFGLFYQRKLDSCDAEILFLKRMGKKVLPHNLKEVSDQILKKCNGLPREIIRVTEREEMFTFQKEDWKHVLESLNSKSQSNELIMGMTLGLPSCLLYLSMFPVEFEISKDQLEAHWLAHKYVREQDVNKCVRELVHQRYISPANFRDDGEVMSCQVNSRVVKDIIEMATRKIFLIIRDQEVPDMSRESRTKVEHLSLQCTEDVAENIFTHKIIHPKSTLECKGFTRFKNVMLLDLRKFRKLVALDLTGCTGLECKRMKIICKLVNLRYLNLRNTDITTVPKKIHKLKLLMTLDLRGTNIEELPNRLLRLTKLANLLCSTPLPVGINKMTSLQMLSGFKICRSSQKSIEQLKMLANLRRLSFDDEDEEIKTELESAFWRSVDVLLKAKVSHLVLPRALKVPELLFDKKSNLQSLKLEGKVTKIPDWFSHLENLAYLELSETYLEDVDDGMLQLGKLHNLELLKLNLPEISKSVVFKSSQFNSLKRLILRIMLKAGQPKLPVIFEGKALPNLELLYMVFSWEQLAHIDADAFTNQIEHLGNMREVAVGATNTIGETARQVVASIIKRKTTHVIHLQSRKEAHYYYNWRVRPRRFHFEIQDMTSDGQGVKERDGSNLEDDASLEMYVIASNGRTMWPGGNSAKAQVEGIVSKQPADDASTHSLVHTGSKNKGIDKQTTHEWESSSAGPIESQYCRANKPVLILCQQN